MVELVYLSSSEGTFVNKFSASIWEQNVPLALSFFFFIPMRQSLYNSLSKKRKNTEAKSINLTFMYIDDVLSIIQTLRTGLY